LKIPRLIQHLPRSGIRELMGLALQIQDAIHLEIGEPHFPTPSSVLGKLADFYWKGEIKYTPTTGIASLRRKIAEKFSREKNWPISEDQVIVLPGSLFGTVVAFRALLDSGEETLLPDPGFTNHFAQAILCGATLKRYPLLPENGFLPDIDFLRKIASNRTRMILVNSPSNPIGVTFDESTASEIARLAEELDLIVIADEAYEKFVYRGNYTGMHRFVNPQRLISLFSFSKTYALSGWRIGCMIAPPELVPALSKVAEYLIACSSHISQKAAEIALDLPEEEIQKMRDYYFSNVELACHLLKEGKMKFFQPQGGYYVWVDIRDYGMPSLDFCKQLLSEEKVALAPGDTFGENGEGFVRISICRTRQEVEEGVKRLVRFARRKAL